jgi:hypothetical protein
LTGNPLTGLSESGTDMKVFGRAYRPVEARTQEDCSTVLDLMRAHGLTHAEAARWCGRPASWEVELGDDQGTDAGETGAGMVVAVGACLSVMIFMAAFGQIFGLVT